MSNQKKTNTMAANALLCLKEKQYITPHYIRATFTTDDIALFSETTIGVNNKIFIPPAGVKEVYFPEFDLTTGKWLLPDAEVCPKIRTYTHRGINLEKKEMIIDFVAHGENGPASAWITNAKPGDEIGVTMWTAKTDLYPAADWYLLAGDATAIPVLSVILETLPETATGIALIEVNGKEDEQDIFTKANIEIKWIHTPHPEQGSQLAKELREISIPEPEEKTRFGYVAAEFSAVKAIRSYLRNEMFWERYEYYAYSYWKAGVAEDGS